MLPLNTIRFKMRFRMGSWVLIYFITYSMELDLHSGTLQNLITQVNVQVDFVSFYLEAIETRCDVLMMASTYGMMAHYRRPSRSAYLVRMAGYGSPQSLCARKRISNKPSFFAIVRKQATANV